MDRQIVHNQAGAELPMHRHDEARVVVVLNGEICETDLFGKRHYKKGEFLFRPPFCAHANISEGASTSFLRLKVSRAVWMKFVSIYGWHAARGYIDLDRPHNRLLLRSRRGGDLLMGMLDERPSGVESLPFEFGGVEPAIGESRAPESLCSPISGVAETMDLKPYELTRLVARRFGLTPTAYRREARLRRALKFLVEPSTRLARIAVDCGYSDQSHFSREIKSATGRSPLVLREYILAE